MIRLLIKIISLALTVINWAVLIYCLLSILAPESQLFKVVSGYVDPILDPFRRIIRRLIPAAAGWRIDLSPVLLWLVIRVVRWIIGI